MPSWKMEDVEDVFLISIPEAGIEENEDGEELQTP